jgi:hypothetical protein
MIFPVTLSQRATSTVTVNYSVTGNGTPGFSATGGTKAAPGVDFKLKSGTITFKADAHTGLTPISKTISVIVYGDTNASEADETIAVTLSNPVGGGAGLGRYRGAGTIINDDGITSATTMGVSSASIVNAASGAQSLTFQVKLSATSVSAASVAYAITPNTATYSAKVSGGGNYGGKIAGTLNFAPGVTTQSITIPIWPTSNLVSDETFTITLTGLNGTGITVIGNSATGTIVAF